ncbi:MAG: cytochrome c, partial [Bryobacteraceae bacterium]|nr:cytochrome c [Bryobacteraceae bacterium]
MRKLVALSLLPVAMLLTGCGGAQRQPSIYVFPDMKWQGRYDPQQDRPFFADRRASQKPVAGTVARGFLKNDEGYYTGVVSNQWIGRNPEKMDADLMALGERRFNTYCTPCHDKTGQGRGLVGVRAIWIPTNLTEDRVKQFNDGEIFHVITNGRRSMPPYKFQ